MTNKPLTSLNMLLFTDHATEEHFPVLEALKEAGFDGVEFPVWDGDTAHWQRIKKKVDELGLRCTASTWLTGEKNAISEDPTLRKAAVDHLKWALEMCAIIGAERLVGPYHSAYKEFTGTGPTADEKKRAAEVLHEVAEFAGQRNIQLGIEFLNRFECYFLTTAEDARALTKAVDHPAFGILWDTHHAHIEEKDVAAGIRACGSDINHVHISENDRGTPGTGQVRWQETFEALHAIDYDGWLTIEAFSRHSPDFVAAIHIWRDYFADPYEVIHEGGKFIHEMWQKTGS